MKEKEILKNTYAMPITSPSYSKGPYKFVDREYLIITYKTDIDALKKVVPEPLQVKDALVKYEFIKMPDSSGFGSYTESGQVIPITYKGRKGGYVHSMYLDSEAPISGGREIWGFPKKLAYPTLKVEKDTLLGTLDYGSVTVATGTMGYKYKEFDKKVILKAMNEPQFLLKIIPDVDGKLKICELVEYHTKNIKIKGAWTGPASLELHSHALAKVADLPVLEVVSALHFVVDLTLGYGKVVHDYLKKKKR
ncbi:MAG: putative acetoacetate decarboxylase [Candidatus Anoxychlamydiales bacterium]|nr:putative acetoacetate decarboxylase [Candidatus Anoxychlamydiales bacterium]